MYLYSVIPITNIPLPHKQIMTYYSSEFLYAGCVVNIQLRKKVFRAVVIKRYSAKEQKTTIKDSTFELKKIHSIISSQPIISKDTLLLAIQTSNYYYLSTGLILKSILPKVITENDKKLKNLLEELEEKETNTINKQNSILKIQKEESSDKKGLSIYPSSNLLPKNKSTLKESKETAIYWINKKNPNTKELIGSKKHIFFPINSSSTITINKENSGLYEANQRIPKIDSRIIARIRNKKEDIPLVSIDSTPSVAMYYFFKKNNYEIKNTPQQISPLTIINSQKQTSSITKTLKQKIQKTTNNEQAIIFTHRKGLATAMICNFCGYIFKCKDCDTPYVLHQNFMLCHRCMQKKETIPTNCVYCASSKIKLLPGGTSYIERQIKQINPDLKIKTIDNELIKTKKERDNIFENFRDKKYNILIGNKTIINNFPLLPKVNYTAIINIDTLVNIPYYASTEEAFTTIWRMREKAKEQSFVQTHTPNIQLFLDAQKNTPLYFLENQLNLRRQINAPPFSQEIQLVCQDNQEYNARKNAVNLRNTLTKFINQNKIKNITILGPAPSYEKKKKGYFRWYILLQNTQPEEDADFQERNKILSIIPKKWEIIINPNSSP